MRKIDSVLILRSQAGKVGALRSPHERLVNLVAENVGGIANHYARRKIRYAGGIPDVVVLHGKDVKAIHEIEMPWGRLSNLESRNLRLVKARNRTDRWLWIVLPARTKRAFNHIVLIG